MSLLTDFAENALADFVRGQGITLPTDWHIGLLSAASDASVTELAGTGYARIAVARSLAAWAGTQGAGTTLPSTGTSHGTSNNAAVDWGAAGSAWGTASHIGLFDAASGGECWMIQELQAPIVIGASDPVAIEAGAIAYTLGLVGGMSDYLANKLIDLLFRGQAYTWPASTYAALYTTAPSNAGGGTEVAGGSYARVAIASSMVAWSGTQGAGTTAASTGTGGRISNNAAINYPAPTAAWGAVSHEGLRDASTLGNLLFWGALASPKTVSAGAGAPTHAAGSMKITFA